MNKKLLALLFAVPGFGLAQTTFETYKVLGFAPSLEQVAVDSKDVEGHDVALAITRNRDWYADAKPNEVGLSRSNQTQFRLIKTDKPNIYKLYSLKNKKFVAYTDANGGPNKTTFVDSDANPKTDWLIVPNIGQLGTANKFDIFPGSVTNPQGGTQAWNAFGGASDNARIGHYAANDGGSCWSFEIATQELKFFESYSAANESYFMTIRDNYVHKNGENFTADKNLQFGDDNYRFQLVGTPQNFKIYNAATGNPIGTDPSKADDKNNYSTTQTSTFSVQSYGGRVYVKETRKPNLYLNFRDGFLSTWNSADAWNGRDEGSRILFTTEDGILAEAAKKLAEEIKSTYTDDKFGGGLNQYPKSAQRAVTQTLDSLQAAQDLTNSDITKKKEKYTNAKLLLDFLRLNMPQDGDLLYLSFQRDANVKYLTSALHEASENGWGPYGSLGGHLTGKAGKGNDALFCLKLDAQGKATLVSVATGRRVAWEKRTDGKYYPTLASKDGEGAAFTISTRNGKYAFEADGRYLASDANGNYAEAYSDYDPQFAGIRLDRVGTTLPVHIGESGYASFWCPFEYTVPEGVTAFRLHIVGGHVIFTSIEGNVPKNTGIILKGTANTDVNLTLVPNGNTPAIADNLLQGSAEPKAITTLTTPTTPVYALKKTGGFMKVRDYMPAFKAYFTATESQVRELLERGLTGIVNVEAQQEQAPIYDLSGRRVQNTTKGQLYITNGKKFIAK